MKNRLSTLTFLLATAGLCTPAFVKPPSSGDNFELLILHNNDMHARFEQTSQLSGACTTADREAGKCYGGFPRVAHVVKEARKAAQNGEGPPVLYLNAGDTYTGTAWFTIYKWKIAAEFINALQPDAVALGNNEIEKGSSKMSQFINSIQTKILASNVILQSEDNENIQKSIIFDISGVKVGIVGYLTPDQNILDDSINLEYIDEIIAVKEEVEKLKTMDVNIIIALGHSNLNKDIEIAKEVEGLDLVIAGQKNKFNFDGATKEYAATEEPIIVTQESGRKVPVVQSSSYNKYLGSLLTEFDDKGEIIEYNSKPILLDEFIPEDPEALKVLQSHHDELTARSAEVVGTTAVVLDGSTCKFKECNFGNMIVDAMTYYYAINYEGDVVWTNASIAVIPSGYIANSIAPENRPASITQGDLLQALPRESNLVVVSMSGTILLEVLEQSVAYYSVNTPTGQFLQVSGIRAVYDLSKEPGSRLVDAVVRCYSCFVPQYFTIDDWRTYYVIMPASLAEGEYGFTMLSELEKETLVYDELTCVSEFIKLRSPVYPEVAGRIVLNTPEEIDNTTEEPNSTTEETNNTTEETNNTTEETITTTEETSTTTEETGSASRLTSTTLIIVTLLSIFINI